MAVDLPEELGTTLDLPEYPMVEDTQLSQHGTLISIMRSAGLKVIDRAALAGNAAYDLLVCSTCGCAISPASAADHVKGHGIPLSLPQRKELADKLQDMTIAGKTSDIPVQPFDLSPIDGLLVRDGFRCMACEFATLSAEVIRKHASASHPSQETIAPAKLQYAFAKHPQIFAVQPGLAVSSGSSRYAIYRSQNLRQRQAAAEAIAQPASEKEIPLLVRLTGWHEHLKDFTKTKASIRELRDLVDIRTTTIKHPWLGSRLRDTIVAQMKVVKQVCFKVTLGVRMLVMEYPR